MSRTRHRTDPDVARRRRAMKASTDKIKEAWSHTGWGRAKVREFRAVMRGLSGEEWWRQVFDIRHWMPKKYVRWLRSNPR